MSPRLRYPRLRRPHVIRGPIYSGASSIDKRTAASTGQLTSVVRITHPFHPQCGEEIEVLVRRVQWGEDRVFYRAAQGHRASIPATWTSLVADDPFVAMAEGRARFRVDDLLELVTLVSGLSS